MDSRDFHFQEVAKKGLAELRLSAALASSEIMASTHTQNRQPIKSPTRKNKPRDKNDRRTSLREVKKAR